MVILDPITRGDKESGVPWERANDRRRVNARPVATRDGRRGRGLRGVRASTVVREHGTHAEERRVILAEVLLRYSRGQWGACGLGLGPQPTSRDTAAMGPQK